MFQYILPRTKLPIVDVIVLEWDPPVAFWCISVTPQMHPHNSVVGKTLSTVAHPHFL
jgi:hypothetical protein